ncbi:ComEA family DNA-binding protein [Patescibacteria group bacterium]|nr:ComEA family DNA-binding protein [Patescibacteria group bacterium]MBU1868145.1 ComEA family DNA-binding protein [Patescibacteria group bacterium]
MPKENPVDEVLSELIKKYCKELGIFLVVVIVAGGLFLSYLLSQQSRKQEIEIKDSSEVLSVVETAEQAVVKIVVDVSGAVGNPGVHKLEEGSRVQEAVDAAGGFSNQADLDFVAKNINLAQRLSDGEKVYIPTKEETQESTAVEGLSQGLISGVETGAEAVQSSTEKKVTQILGKISINTASRVELESLSGIGPVYAQRIIDERPFSTIEDIMRVNGIGPKTFEKIKGRITM